MGVLTNASQIRKVMDTMKEDMYAIVNPDLKDMNELIKSLYLKVLCTTILYLNEPSDSQLLYLKRIVKGFKSEESPEALMTKALNISAEDIRDFIEYMREKNTRYYFALDALVLTALGEQSQLNREYLAELIEITDIAQNELQCLILIARSIITQDASLYEKAKPMMTDSMKQNDFSPYIESFYASAKKKKLGWFGL